MLLLKHKGTVYGTVDRGDFTPSEALLRLDAGQEPARSLWVLGQAAAQTYIKHGYTIAQARVRSHVVPRA